MKKPTVILLCGLVTTTLAFAQDGEDTVVRIVPPQIGQNTPVISGGDVPSGPESSVAAHEEAQTIVANPADANQNQAAASGDAPREATNLNPENQEAPVAGAEGEDSIAEEDGGFLIKDANINDIFQLLSKRGGKQYFHNNKLNADDYKVTGHLNGDGSPLKQMEELAFQYGLKMYVKGNTVYAMLNEQLENLPAKEWTYSLNYLRPTDIEQIKALIQPMLTAGRGMVNFEPKTNTIVVIDTMHHIEMVESLLRKIDKPKGQIVIEVKILRVNSSMGQQSGVDWSQSLGTKGVSLDIIQSLSSVFGLPTEFTAAASTGSAAAGSTETLSAGTSNVILTPLQLSGVLRALNEGNLVTQKSNPVVITEDNEKAIISLIDRVPIITSTVNNTGNGASTTTDEVRYKIDQSDSTDPDKTREIGVTISMTPSLLPDGTIRMQMRPRNAQIVENVVGPSGNSYPRVSEATIESIARIPDGNSLIVGGFYGALKSNAKNKVPILGSIPLVKFFFKSKQTKKEQSSLVFVVTPTSYDPSCLKSNRATSTRIENQIRVKPGNDVDLDSASESSRSSTVRGLRSGPSARYPQR